jgi:hypothetical protein
MVKTWTGWHNRSCSEDTKREKEKTEVTAEAAVVPLMLLG